MERQSEIAKTIGTEADEQLALLDDIDFKTARTTRRVEIETARVQEFSFKSSTGALWVVIFFLVIALCVIIVLAFYLPKGNHSSGGSGSGSGSGSSSNNTNTSDLFN